MPAATLAIGGACGDKKAPEPPPPAAGTAVATGTRQQLFDAWLASDAMLLATYRGVDSTLGRRYHVADVEKTWSGPPAPQRLVFKAPRGIRVAAGARTLLLVWDRLAGAPDSYLEEAKARHGDAVWDAIGHDSLAAYLLPFAAYAYPLDGDALVLRGQSPFSDRIGLDALEADVRGWEVEHAPPALYARSAVVVRARVASAETRPRTLHGIVSEYRVHAAFTPRETYKGDTPDPLALEFISFPRAPRFRAGEDVVLFLARNEQGLYLAAGKRAVFHVVDGEVLEAGRPLATFVEHMRGARDDGAAGRRP
jgi:hypothetical protein